MTLHELRLAVGDDAFFTILQQWASSHAGGNVTTAEFITLAETISGQQLDELFQTWLFTPGKPAVISPARGQSSIDDGRSSPRTASSRAA